MKTIIAALLASTVAFPAFAEPWVEQPIAANGYANGYAEQRPGDLKTAQAENQAAERESNDRLIEQGGCSAPVRPVNFAIACDAFLSSHSAFGGDQNGQMGSTGGD